MSVFRRGSVSLRAGVPARLTFIRRAKNTCATEVVIPEQDIKRDLPLDTPVVIDFTPRQGELKFSCGMNMYNAKIPVR